MGNKCLKKLYSPKLCCKSKKAVGRTGQVQGIAKCNCFYTGKGAEKTAHLLYLTIKDHPFFDGNKRTGSFLFVYFLDRNDYLYRETGEKKINDNALTALALLIAESNPKDKEILIKIITNLIAD